ncbi:MAG: Hsp70 family protein [Aphanocapsa lilacina HA4352-LM1]|nr:Hsp70 family protein [Aphanocapsa lilacina HA4352-LM1]
MPNPTGPGVAGARISITWIAEDYLDRAGLTRRSVGETAWQNLILMAESAKIRLSTQSFAAESWFDEQSFETHELRLDRDGLEAILERQQLLDRLREAGDEVLDQAYSRGVTKKEIAYVVLMGGTSLIPAVRKQLVSLFGRGKVRFGKPFEAVAHGALTLARYGAVEDHLRHTYLRPAPLESVCQDLRIPAPVRRRHPLPGDGRTDFAAGQRRRPDGSEPGPGRIERRDDHRSLRSCHRHAAHPHRQCRRQLPAPGQTQPGEFHPRAGRGGRSGTVGSALRRRRHRGKLCSCPPFRAATRWHWASGPAVRPGRLSALY